MTSSTIEVLADLVRKGKSWRNYTSAFVDEIMEAAGSGNAPNSSLERPLPINGCIRKLPPRNAPLSRELSP